MRRRRLLPARLPLVKYALTLFVLLLAVSAAAETPGEVLAGGTLREAAMRGLNGPDAKLSAYRGKPLIINVWASWCGPCRDEMASLERVSRRAGGKFAVIGISTDDYPEVAKAYLKRANTSFRHFIDDHLFLENMLGADRIPVTLLVDAKGRVIEKFYGAKEWDGAEARAVIESAFGLRLGTGAALPIATR